MATTELAIEKSGIERACDLVGGQSELARKLNIRPQAVQKWVAAGVVPPRRAVKVQDATEGEIKAYELSPFIPKTAA